MSEETSKLAPTKSRSSLRVALGRLNSSVNSAFQNVQCHSFSIFSTQYQIQETITCMWDMIPLFYHIPFAQCYPKCLRVGSSFVLILLLSCCTAATEGLIKWFHSFQFHSFIALATILGQSKHSIPSLERKIYKDFLQFSVGYQPICKF